MLHSDIQSDVKWNTFALKFVYAHVITILFQQYISLIINNSNRVYIFHLTKTK